jgi:hypothetical protein
MQIMNKGHFCSSYRKKLGMEDQGKRMEFVLGSTHIISIHHYMMPAVVICSLISEVEMTL